MMRDPEFTVSIIKINTEHQLYSSICVVPLLLLALSCTYFYFYTTINTMYLYV